MSIGFLGSIGLQPFQNTTESCPEILTSYRLRLHFSSVSFSFLISFISKSHFQVPLTSSPRLIIFNFTSHWWLHSPQDSNRTPELASFRLYIAPVLSLLPSCGISASCISIFTFRSGNLITCSLCVMYRAHSFRGPRNFEPIRGILVFFRGFFEPRNLTAEFVFFPVECRGI